MPHGARRCPYVLKVNFIPKIFIFQASFCMFIHAGYIGKSVLKLINTLLQVRQADRGARPHQSCRTATTKVLPPQEGLRPLSISVTSRTSWVEASGLPAPHMGPGATGHPSVWEVVPGLCGGAGVWTRTLVLLRWSSPVPVYFGSLSTAQSVRTRKTKSCDAKADIKVAIFKTKLMLVQLIFRDVI